MSKAQRFADGQFVTPAHFEFQHKVALVRLTELQVVYRTCAVLDSTVEDEAVLLANSELDVRPLPLVFNAGPLQLALVGLDDDYLAVPLLSLTLVKIGPSRDWLRLLDLV